MHLTVMFHLKSLGDRTFLAVKHQIEENKNFLWPSENYEKRKKKCKKKKIRKIDKTANGAIEENEIIKIEKMIIKRKNQKKRKIF